MPAKRKSKSAARSTEAGSPSRITRPEGEAIKPIVLPGDGTGAAGESPAPKGGPVNRGGAQFAGVGRGRGAQASRRYAFRRS